MSLPFDHFCSKKNIFSPIPIKSPKKTVINLYDAEVMEECLLSIREDDPPKLLFPVKNTAHFLLQLLTKNISEIRNFVFELQKTHNLVPQL